jgi:hypothetical protein
MQRVYGATLPDVSERDSQFLVCLRKLYSLRSTIGTQLKTPLTEVLPITNVEDTWWVVVHYKSQEIVEWRYYSADASTTFIVRGEETLVILGDEASVYNTECASAVTNAQTPDTVPNNHIVGLERVYPLTTLNEILRIVSEVPSEKGERLHQKLDRLNKLGYKLVLLQNGKVLVRAPKAEDR